jgi:hypothetical protein
MRAAGTVRRLYSPPKRITPLVVGQIEKNVVAREPPVSSIPDETADQLIANAFVFWRNQMPYDAAIQRTMQQMLLSTYRIEAALGMSYPET